MVVPQGPHNSKYSILSFSASLRFPQSAYATMAPHIVPQLPHDRNYFEYTKCCNRRADRDPRSRLSSVREVDHPGIQSLLTTCPRAFVVADVVVVIVVVTVVANVDAVVSSLSCLIHTTTYVVRIGRSLCCAQ